VYFLQKNFIPRNILLTLGIIIKTLRLTMSSSKTVLELCQIADTPVHELEKLLGLLDIGKKHETNHRVRILAVCSMEVYDKKRKLFRPCKSRPLKGQEMCCSHTRQRENQLELRE
jgi:hypothetical protein